MTTCGILRSAQDRVFAGTHFHPTFSFESHLDTMALVPSLTQGPAKDDIPALRDSLSTLESTIRCLMTQHNSLKSRLARAVALQSPIRRLPNEILSTIFAIGTVELDEEDPLFLSNVTLVCKHWNEVASATPVLWSRIVISPHDSLSKARLRLERSKAVPLDILIGFTSRTTQGESVAKEIIEAMDLLRPSVARWRSLRLRVPNRPHAHAALIMCREPAPLLEELSIQVAHSMQEDTYSTAPLPLFQGYLPRLRSCSFTSFNFGWDTSLVHNLQVLKLNGFWQEKAPTSMQLLGVLVACPDLVELSLRNMNDVETDGDFPRTTGNSEPVVTLPRLKTASFYYSGVVRTRQILSQIATPALETVEFFYLDDITGILQVLKRQTASALPLRTLRIESSFFNELKLMRLLHRLPTLVNLVLTDCEDVSANLLKGLSTPPQAHEWICPKLETLNLVGCSCVDWEALRFLIESRLPHNVPQYVPKVSVGPMRVPSLKFDPPRRLRGLDLTRCNQISREMVQWLRMYVSDVSCESAKGVWIQD